VEFPAFQLVPIALPLILSLSANAKVTLQDWLSWKNYHAISPTCTISTFEQWSLCICLWFYYTGLPTSLLWGYDSKMYM